MFRAGTFVAEHVEPTAEAQVQPNGVDLTVAGVHRQTAPGRIGRDGKRIGEREPVGTTTRAGGGGTDGGAIGADADADEPVPTYDLDPGGYLLEYGETIAVPEGHVGYVYPRSSLMRNSCTLNTAVWDAGYEGRGEGLLQVHHPIRLVQGARVAQFVLARAEDGGVYDGSYQGERLGEE